jgi:carbonic anhydrase
MALIGHGQSCACCGDLGTFRFGRRALLLGAAGAAMLPRFARAASGDYEAMILACIDPRMQTPVRDYAVKGNLEGKYSQFVFAGAAIGAVAPKFADWHKTFWDNLAITIQLHNIKSVIAIDHRDCGAAKVAYGDDCCSTPEKEDATHKAALAEFRKQVGERQPSLKVETMLMALDGTHIPLG